MQELKSAEAVRDLPTRLGIESVPEARAALGLFLRALVHDLNGTLGTFALESFGLGDLAQQLDAAAGRADPELIRSVAIVLQEIRDNLDRSQSKAGDLLKKIRAEAYQWTEEAESAPRAG